MEQTTTTAAAAQRPGFLSTLCILSFIGAGISIVFSVIGFLGAQAAQTMMDGVGAMGDAMGATGNTEFDTAMAEAQKLMKYAYVLLGVGVVCAVLSLVGAIMMWKLKKTGFFIYTFANLVAMILPIVLVGFVGGGMAYVGPIVTIAFIAMYAMNLKHMTK